MRTRRRSRSIDEKLPKLEEEPSQVVLRRLPGGAEEGIGRPGDITPDEYVSDQSKAGADGVSLRADLPQPRVPPAVEGMQGWMYLGVAEPVTGRFIRDRIVRAERRPSAGDVLSVTNPVNLRSQPSINGQLFQELRPPTKVLILETLDKRISKDGNSAVWARVDVPESRAGVNKPQQSSP